MSEETNDPTSKYRVVTESPAIAETLTTKPDAPTASTGPVLVVDNTEEEEGGRFPPAKPEVVQPKSPFSKGDWVRYYVNGKVPNLAIAQVEYVVPHKAGDGKSSIFELRTDRGVVFSPAVVEHRKGK